MNLKIYNILLIILFFTLIYSCKSNESNKKTKTSIEQSNVDDKKNYFGSHDLMPINYSSSSNDIAYGFDYPIGNKGIQNGYKVAINEKISNFDGNTYNVDRNEEYNLDKNYAANNKRIGSNSGADWYVLSDVGNLVTDEYTKGLHPGEDWNYGTVGDDAGKPVYSVANGKIYKINKVYSDENSAGWQIIIKHTLPDRSYVYSVYTHVTSANETDGNIVSNESSFTVSEGDSVKKGDRIARLATGMTYFGEHLHFEIRNGNYTGSLYPNANGNGYYTDKAGTKRESMTKTQVLSAFKLMRKDGVLDPSDFIDDHREIAPIVGNGSVIAYHGAQRSASTLILDSQYPYGVTKDITVSHKNYVQQSGFFQWQVTGNCKFLKIDHADRKKIADITVGIWHRRDNDTVFKNVYLPFVLGANNMNASFNYDGNDWYVVSVALRPNASSYGSTERISATCLSNGSATNHRNNYDVASNIVMIGEHQWNGNGSIISRIFGSYSDNLYSGSDSWPYGVFKDVTVVHKNQYKPAVFFQWMSSSKCSSITIDADLPSNEKRVRLGTKNWSSQSYVEEETTLPKTLNKERLWTVIRVLFEKPVSRDARVNATCTGF